MKKTSTAVLTTVALFAAVPASAHYYDGCQKDKCKSHVIEPHQAHLRAIATCESGRRWNYSGPGYYDGGLQFDPGTWTSVGGAGFAYQHSPREQKYRAVILAHRVGCWRCTAGWPHCG